MNGFAQLSSYALEQLAFTAPPSHPVPTLPSTQEAATQPHGASPLGEHQGTEPTSRLPSLFYP